MAFTFAGTDRPTSATMTYVMYTYNVMYNVMYCTCNVMTYMVAALAAPAVRATGAPPPGSALHRKGARRAG